jgi:steroid delta-isomerase-like uncharacterized protein
MYGCSENNSVAETQGRALIEIWQNGNVEDLDLIMAANSVYEAAQQAHSYKGLEEVKSYVGHVVLFAKDLKIEVISARSAKSSASVEWVMTGVQDRPIPGRVTVPTNKEFMVKGVTLIEVEDGLITKATDYMDVLGFVIQLGARVELPGGVVLEME